MTHQTEGRVPLNRARVLAAAVAFADESGIDPLSMRSLAHRLGVVPMALYKHVANKEELLDGMVDVVVGEIAPPTLGVEWQDAVRQRILSARGVLLRHPWAPRVLESRSAPTAVALDYMDSMIAMLRAGGLPIDLTHHAMHALGSRVFGLTPELFTGGQEVDPEVKAAATGHLVSMYPNVGAVLMAASHDEGSVVGPGCDDQFEFEFALDILLDGFEQRRQRGWSSAIRRTEAPVGAPGQRRAPGDAATLARTTEGSGEPHESAGRAG